MRVWYVWAAGWGVLTFAGLAVNIPAVEDSDLDKYSSLVMVIAWVGAFVHTLALRGEYGRRVGEAGRDPVLAARQRLKERRHAQQNAREEPDLARELGIGPPDVRGAKAMGVVDINHAAATSIAKLPEVAGELAERIVATRDEIRGSPRQRTSATCFTWTHPLLTASVAGRCTCRAEQGGLLRQGRIAAGEAQGRRRARSDGPRCPGPARAHRPEASCCVSTRGRCAAIQRPSMLFASSQRVERFRYRSSVGVPKAR
ncbi:MAG: helix-hairpin-helix domain-containing protein [Actinobacteria bacterium]|nr:helix-hairpin-helix domain-containing protein [Actinomycetota bacterium]